MMGRFVLYLGVAYDRFHVNSLGTFCHVCVWTCRVTFLVCYVEWKILVSQIVASSIEMFGVELERIFCNMHPGNLSVFKCGWAGDWKCTSIRMWQIHQNITLLMIQLSSACCEVIFCNLVEVYLHVLDFVYVVVRKHEVMLGTSYNNHTRYCFTFKSLHYIFCSWNDTIYHRWTVRSPCSSWWLEKSWQVFELRAVCWITNSRGPFEVIVSLWC